MGCLAPVLETPLVVSDAQLASALSGSGLGADRVERIAYACLAARLAELRADAVVIGARGPLVRVLARDLAALEPRPVVVTGLPGISIPATRKAVVYRLQSDLFVVHSRREVREFGALSARTGYAHRYALATLPFARGAVTAGGVPLRGVVRLAQRVRRSVVGAFQQPGPVGSSTQVRSTSAVRTSTTRTP